MKRDKNLKKTNNAVYIIGSIATGIAAMILLPKAIDRLASASFDHRQSKITKDLDEWDDTEPVIVRKEKAKNHVESVVQDSTDGQQA